jgi:5,10-methylene-tetrahydrofolate dehydrogenase/methenyl tetrahydrofolate cyclohydrolase
VQLPLPKHINEEKILSEISIEKDVDGFHPLNIGKLAMKGREPLFVPCTPKVLKQFASILHQYNRTHDNFYFCVCAQFVPMVLVFL